MFFSFLSRLSLSKASVNNETVQTVQYPKIKNSQKILEEATESANGIFLQNFTLFHHENSFTLDILIFLPHYGLYLGEKIAWKTDELKKAHLERSNKHGKKNPTTQLELSEALIQHKLEDVLSFNFTPIERFFWMENLSEAEFDLLDDSFHKLLPKNRLIFKDDTIQSIQNKLHTLGTHQDEPYSKLKVIGSLKAHTLLLPTDSKPFGAFLSQEQQHFLDTPFGSSIVALNGGYGSGKSTVLIRKVIQILLEQPLSKVIIIAPTLLNTEMLREELIAITEFAALVVNLSNIHFFPLSTHNEPIETASMFYESSLIVCDDAHLFKSGILESIMAHQGNRTLLLSSTVALDESNTYTLKNSYRTPLINRVHFSHTKGALFTVLSGLHELRKKFPKSPILIILPDELLIDGYKHAIDEHLHLESQILNTAFSLQYKNFDAITLSTPQFINSLEAPHCYLVNLNPEDPLYWLALSRASESVTIISEDIH
ncbi:MAG: hypothetical protein Q7T91_10725 [Sulfuricurvum sp.]|nr:hypothetical protein [Sulfuricurvum sp.]